MSVQRALVVFKAFRIVVFAICMMLSIGCGTIFSIVLVREWPELGLVSRIVVVILTVIHFLGAIMLYLRIVVRFTVWLDTARVTIYLALVGGGAVLFISGRAKLPCTSTGIGLICTQATISIVIGSLVVSGLLLCYLVGLSIIAHTIPGPLLARAPADILDGGLSTIDSTTSLVPSTEKSEYNVRKGVHQDRPFPRHHPQPLNLTARPEYLAPRSAFNYMITSSPSASSLSTPMTSEMRYTSPLIPHPYATSDCSYASESPPPSARPFSPYSNFPASARDSSRAGYSAASTLSPVSSVRSVSAQRLRQVYDGGRLPLQRSESPRSAPSFLEVPSTSRGPLPNPFQDAVSRTSTPGTPSTVTSGPLVHVGSSNVSLSFGSRGFPLPPSYNTTTWSHYTNDYLKSYPSNPSPTETSPSTPLSLRPRVQTTMKNMSLSPAVVEKRRPISFGSIAVSLHAIGIPNPPAPAAHLPPHPRLQAHFDSVPLQTDTEAEISFITISSRTPTSAKTFRSQIVPTDIPDWEHKAQA
ncbi:hypothetical protein GYMLUDRAFT_44215 [Collybiopsis luxurians FD-317 M1]|uniref:Uncharacterized protein n=1 Tax=Collybiopsis luxurians FD-317 M1 TaxID=944289 RepID=A0A0D0CB93_9AGAR|nr:hypothetical protein GYMLUDRAFT_44215 [Collybiopsis luxurians FD-317 M1]